MKHKVYKLLPVCMIWMGAAFCGPGQDELLRLADRIMLECFTEGLQRDAARQRAQAAIAANPDAPGDAALSAVLDIDDDRLLQGTKGCQSALEEYALVHKSRPHAGGYNL